ncbi:MAG: CoA-binding protein [Candidatus Methanofastidiosa archaeon]|nr:CoA-binding protein [Candidatus Methanofastidiosa archaeon]
MISSHNIDSFFNPSSIAIIGASDKEGSLGKVLFNNLLESKFDGEVYPITISSETVMGRKAYRSVLDIEGNIDLAVIAIPAKVVNSVLRECAKKGIKSCIVISGGFSETGEVERENELKRIVEETGIRVVGPNCVGILDTHSSVDTIFLPSDRMGRPRMGKISLISQSGAFVAAILDWAAGEGIGMSKIVSFGNKADVNYSDLIDYLSKDEDTSVITIYMEGVGDGRKFMTAAKKAITNKPIIILKSGRSKAGAAAAASHTGSLAGSDIVYSAAFKQSGIIRVYTPQEMFDIAKAFVCRKKAKGRRVAIITDGGGTGVIATDSLADYELELAALEEDTKNRMRDSLPPYCSVKNPIDLTGDADAKRYEIALTEVFKDDNVDAILLILLFQLPTLEDDVIKRLLPMIKNSPKPIIVISPGGGYTRMKLKELEEECIPCYQSSQNAVHALSAIIDYYEYIKKKKL